VATTKVRYSLRTKILVPFTAFSLVTVGVLASSALQARNEVAQQVEGRVSSMAEVFGELFASSVLAGDETNWRQIDQVIESIQKEDAKKGFFAFILVKGGDDEIVGSFNPALLEAKYAQDVSDIRLDRKLLDDLEREVAAAESQRQVLLAHAPDPASRARAQVAEDARVADLRDRAAMRFDSLAEKKRALFGKILADPAGKGLRVYTALIHDCRPSLCPTDTAALAKLPAEATVLVGIAYAPFARERQLNLALLAAIVFLSLVLGGGGAWWIAGSVTRPVKSLVGAIQNVERGVYDRVEVESRDEIGVLARTFNTMAMGLSDK
jgi:HAMP domain-containing protein